MRNGSSPRVRGTGHQWRVLIVGVRFIPACAGNRLVCGRPSYWPPVHPRVCGEQGADRGARHPAGGSSPRVRGTGETAASPALEPRFIPACAGNSSWGFRQLRAGTVHPRVCGEQAQRNTKGYKVPGSSPRVRGTVTGFPIAMSVPRFIPACAGNSGYGPPFRQYHAVHPRVCGEQVSTPTRRIQSCGSSPRVRGTGLA